MRIQWLNSACDSLGVRLALRWRARRTSRARRQRQTGDVAQFDIASGPLADALDRFGDQSGLQIVYDPRLMAGRNAAAVSGRMRRREALDRLLSRFGPGLEAGQRDDRHAGRRCAPARAGRGRRGAGRCEHRSRQRRVVALGDVQVSADPLRLLPNVPSTSAFGFSKLLIETPRSVSSISSETIDFFGLSAVEDLCVWCPAYSPRRVSAFRVRSTCETCLPISIFAV